MLKRSPLLLILCLVISQSGTAQTASMGWLATFNTFKTGKKTSLHNDIQFRSTDEWKQVQTLLFRIGLNVKISPAFTVTAGYAYVNNKRVISPVSGFAAEHRIWEQLLFNHKMKKLAISHRLRLEQRFLPKSRVSGSELENAGNFYANRIRYFIRNVLPLNDRSTFDKGAFAALQNEVFLNVGDNSALNDKVFDQNRLYLAVGFRLSPAFDLEAGYLNQYVNGRNKTFANNHIFQLAGYVRL